MNNFPAKLKPNTTEDVHGNKVPKCTSLELCLWSGKPILGPMHNKTLIEHGGQPSYAELVVLEMFKSEGWDGRWIQSYGKKQYLIDMPAENENVPLPITQETIINKIDKDNWAGRWDLFLWNNKNETLFIELKRRKLDKLRPNQIKWLLSALETDLTVSNFLIVEWDFR